MRRRKVDSTQALIVLALRKAGYHVSLIKEPVDLLVRRPSWPSNVFCLGDAKTPNRAGGKFKPRSDQQEQQDFCNAHGVPYWPSAESALDYLREFERDLGVL